MVKCTTGVLLSELPLLASCIVLFTVIPFILDIDVHSTYSSFLWISLTTRLKWASRCHTAAGNKNCPSWCVWTAGIGEIFKGKVWTFVEVWVYNEAAQTFWCSLLWENIVNVSFSD